MLTITDAASETINRLDMINPFLRLVNKLSLRKARRADYAKTIMGGRFIIGTHLRIRSEGAAKPQLVTPRAGQRAQPPPR